VGIQISPRCFATRRTRLHPAGDPALEGRATIRRRSATRWLRAGALALLGISFAGCQHFGSSTPRPEPLASVEDHPKLNGQQIADVKVALGRSLEKKGEIEQAALAYQEAMKDDPKRADACLRVAVLCDIAGKPHASLEYYRKALVLQPGSPEVYCDMGYSLALQQRWAEAEMNLRQAIALQPDFPRAHNNLGLVLGHEARCEEAFQEFLRAGCTTAEAYSNTGYVLFLEKALPEARRHYEAALKLDPKLAAARKGLQEMERIKGGIGAPAPAPALAADAKGAPTVAQCAAMCVPDAAKR
jgi:Tfp pilus assembly protein PilF